MLVAIAGVFEFGAAFEEFENQLIGPATHGGTSDVDLTAGRDICVKDDFVTELLGGQASGGVAASFIPSIGLVITIYQHYLAH